MLEDYLKLRWNLTNELAVSVGELLRNPPLNTVPRETGEYRVRRGYVAIRDHCLSAGLHNTTACAIARFRRDPEALHMIRR